MARVKEPQAHGGLQLQLSEAGMAALEQQLEVKRVLAIDPSTTSLGWAIGETWPERVKVLELGTLRPAAQYAPERVVQLVAALSRHWQAKGPFDVVVSERAVGFRAQRGGYKVPAELTALMARLKRWALDEVRVGEFVEYHPSTVRAAVVAPSTKGLPAKARIKVGVLAKYPQLATVKASQDALDAVAVLDCYWNKLHQARKVK